MSHFKAIILAAGRGVRMKSDTPKVLHKVAGRPVLEYVLDITKALRSLTTYVVVGHGANEVKKSVGNSVHYVLQDKLLGTGDAVRRAGPFLKNFNGTVLVLCGDTPLLETVIVSRLLAKHQQLKAAATVLTAIVKEPYGYGRIVRDRLGNFGAIREHKDASENELKINEINVGVYCFKAQALFNTLKSVKLNPKKKEYYLTDVIELLLAKEETVATVTTDDETAGFGVNTREDLAQAEKVIRTRILKKLMADGVSIIDPATTYVEAGVKIGHDTVLYPCTFIEGDVTIGKKCQIGPFAHLRPGTRIADNATIGNFTEVSRTKVGRNVMMKHFSFLGDATVGNDVNIGAGTITANYDGKDKNKTVIGDGAFIGSDSILIAPLTIGKKAMVGAGSVVARGKNIPAGMLAVGVPARVIKKVAKGKI